MSGGGYGSYMPGSGRTTSPLGGFSMGYRPGYQRPMYPTDIRTQTGGVDPRNYQSPGAGIGSPQGYQPPQAQTMSQPVSQTPSATYAGNTSFQQFLGQHPELAGQGQVDMLRYGSFGPNGMWSGPDIPAESLGAAAGSSGPLQIRDNVLYRGNQQLMGMLHGWDQPGTPAYEDAMKRLRTTGFSVNLPGAGLFGPGPASTPAATVTPNSGVSKPLAVTPAPANAPSPFRQDIKQQVYNLGGGGRFPFNPFVR